MRLCFLGNTPLNHNLHTVQDALHAAHKISQKGHNGVVVITHKQNEGTSLGFLHHHKLHAPPQIPQHHKTSDESEEEKPGKQEC